MIPGIGTLFGGILSGGSTGPIAPTATGGTAYSGGGAVRVTTGGGAERSPWTTVAVVAGLVAAAWIVSR